MARWFQANGLSIYSTFLILLVISLDLHFIALSKNCIYQCIEYWVNRYQTLLTGIIAVIIGLATIKNERKRNQNHRKSYTYITAEIIRAARMELKNLYKLMQSHPHVDGFWLKFQNTSAGNDIKNFLLESGAYQNAYVVHNGLFLARRINGIGWGPAEIANSENDPERQNHIIKETLNIVFEQIIASVIFEMQCKSVINLDNIFTREKA